MEWSPCPSVSGKVCIKINIKDWVHGKISISLEFLFATFIVSCPTMMCEGI